MGRAFDTVNGLDVDDGARMDNREPELAVGDTLKVVM